MFGVRNKYREILQEHLAGVSTFRQASFGKVKRNGWAFLPGAVFLGVGIAALIAPRLLVAIAAVSFLLIGGLFCFLGWKIVQLKRKIDGFSQQFQGKVILHGVTVEGMKTPHGNRRSGFETDIPAEFTVRDSSSKKIVYH